tara:strand:+ start:102 stop:1472 length:1371 start_codon:yes stop_codon:yes gene_type:complete
MFKKIEIWILYLTIFLGILFAIFFGTLVRQELVSSTKAGWVSKSALFLAEIPSNFKRIVAGSMTDLRLEDRFPSLDGFNGDPNIEESYLLLSRYDGDINQGVVELIDLNNFEILHTWNPDIDEFNLSVPKNDEFKHLSRDNNDAREILYHPLLLKDGGLVFQRTSPLRKIDTCSNLLFQNTSDLFHHSLEKDIDGNIWVPSHIYPQSLPSRMFGNLHPLEGGYYDDAIVKISASGEVLYQKSISKIFIENNLESRLSMIGTTHRFQLDPIHLNDIQPVNYDSQFWKKGDVFISLGHQQMVLLFRPSSDEVIWKLESNIFHQHDIDILNEHKISIFNNNRKYVFGNKSIIDGNNEILIYNFINEEISGYLSDALNREDVRTVSDGLSEILPNGNLFIEETNYGRILLFNADGSLRWTYVNRAADGYIYNMGWSRILYEEEDINIIKKVLNSKDKCSE